ncbi:hypothetical protein L0U85_00930 [Glycomyces sp. L485]|uniref:hypothetical protein n=1 Tax=Glycomyces sp. L485 TaxID=2909235 RepID=UPI001F4AFCAA|nr:hypothetical protein [Glycomyces sp. L485]MCH7229431.1 hypothetical protein [Glycomyces sp. L485]
MTRTGGRLLPLVVLVVAGLLLVASIAWVATGRMSGQAGPGQWGPGHMGGPGYSAGPVEDLDGAQRAANGFAERWDLGVGEVMEFDDGFYAVLTEPDGSGATEVVIDPRSGAVRIEWGPAMMWNTAYGPHRFDAPEGTALGEDQARAIADEWLADHRSGEQTAEVVAFPGYYTIHTEDASGRTAGMLSVHADTGDVWYHTWHGRFIASTGHETDE